MADVGIPNAMDAESSVEAVLDQLEKLAPGLDQDLSRTMSSRLGRLQRILVSRSIEAYDPADRPGFNKVVKTLTEHVPDHGALATLFGVSLSTLYRWKSGESAPNLLARRAVREHLLQLFEMTPEAEAEAPEPRRARAN